jgi:hypothetical protein
LIAPFHTCTTIQSKNLPSPERASKHLWKNKSQETFATYPPLRIAYINLEGTNPYLNKFNRSTTNLLRALHPSKDILSIWKQVFTDCADPPEKYLIPRSRIQRSFQKQITKNLRYLSSLASCRYPSSKALIHI